ncbi:MAG: C25 family cysteine peptidase [Candidatus Electryonea clarkiae]|nr:C25 family cysteine peptidase [Candidatus Electryonea clarkiae]MDP8288437.1 C25 family cysteine peptidase [Candidatus Electryonea clarkiae]
MKYRNGLFVIACVLIIIGITKARDFSVDQGLPLQVSSRIMTDNGMHLTLEIIEPEWKTIGSANEQVSIIDYNLMCGFLEEEGKPSVPVTSRTFRLPPGKIARIEIRDAEYKTFSDVDYAAYLGGTTLEELGQITSSSDFWYPGTIADITTPSYYHDFHVSNLVAYPVQVNTALREVRVYDRMEVDIRFEDDSDQDLSHQQPTAISRTFLPWYRQFLDWDENELDEYELYRGGVQVVMRDEEELWDALAPWIEWKLQKGWELDFLTDEDVNFTASSIRSELRDRYEENKFDFVVIIGDANGDFSTPSSGYADYYYQLMDNDDIYQDVIVSRISVLDVEDVENYVDKVLSYERDPYMDETGWYLNGACLAVWGYHPGESIACCEYVKSELENIGYSQVYFETQEHRQQPWFALGNFINNGITYYSFSGAIGDGLQLNQIHELSNDNKLFVAMELAERTAYWHIENECISEAYIRANDDGTPTGAICSFGLTTASVHWSFMDGITTGAAYAALRMRLPEIGQMLWGGQAAIWNSHHPDWATGNYCYRNFADQSVMFGDPTVWLWTAIPAELNVEADATISLGMNSYTVEVTDNLGDPVEGAWVTLYKVDNNEDVISRGETDSDGIAMLQTPFRHMGEAMLTVTAQNYIPEQSVVDVIEPNARIGYVEISFQDDAENGTNGNDNGVPEAGEIVGLIITARNFGDNNQTNVLATADGEEDWIDNIEGEIEYGLISPGDESTGDGIILVEINPEAQNDWLLHLDVEFDSDQGTYRDDYPLKVHAPAYLYVQITGTDELEPMETAEVSIEIINTGNSDAAASEGQLTILHNFASVVEPLADFESMEVGESSAATYEIHMHSIAIPGYSVPSRLIVTTEEGRVDTAWFSIPLGVRSENEPCGPDRYGYWAFDNRDTEYDLAPEYDWIEINPDADNFDFEGENTGIEARWHENDEAVVIELPFEVQYYGETFDSITINNNGWAAFGSQTQFANAKKNTPIPGPYGPYNMIAPYWDERMLGNESGIFHYYDEDNHRFIIEWYESIARTGANFYDHPCTFEIVIFDLIGEHLTYSEDNEILFQYLDGEMDMTLGYARCTPWWTTGIKDGTQTDGLQYYYWQRPSPGAVDNDQDFEDSLAILFTTNMQLISGSITGSVHDLETNEPMENIFVHSNGMDYFTYSDEEGNYSIGPVYIGTHRLLFEYDCYNTLVTEVDVLNVDDTVTVNAQMRHPEFSLETFEIDRELEPDTEETVEITISNDGNGLLEYEAEVYIDDPRVRPDQTDTAWNNLHAFDLSPEEANNYGLIFCNGYFYVSGANSFDPFGPNRIYKYDNTGRDLVTTYDQPPGEDDRSFYGMRGLAWDGEYLYGVDDGQLYQMEIFPDSLMIVDQWEAPLASAHYLEWDPDRDLFWMGDHNSDIYAIDRNGDTAERFEREFIPRGAAWNPNDVLGRNLYFFSQLTSRSDIEVVRMNPETGDCDTVHTIPYPAGRWALTGADYSSTWNPLVHVFSAVINQTEEGYVQVWYLNDNETFFSINNPDGTVGGGEEDIVEFVLNSTGFPIGSYTFFVGFENNACEEENNFIEITMTLPDTTDKINDPEIEQPLEWSFDGAYPNPFNQTLTVRFALKETVIVKVKIYNLLGQKIADIADLPMTAGRYAVPFDGSGMASGMYFLQFEAGPLHETKKIVLLK